ESMTVFFRDIFDSIREFLTRRLKKKPASYLVDDYICDFFKNAVSCCGGSNMLSPFVSEILQIIFSTSTSYFPKSIPILTQQLLSCLIEISTLFPEYLSYIQNNLLEIISVSLFDIGVSNLTSKYLLAFNLDLIKPKDNFQEIIASLRALYNFNFHNLSLDVFSLGISLHFIKHDSKSIREESIICLCYVIEKSVYFTINRSDLVLLSCQAPPNETIGRILNVGLLDFNEEIRNCVYTSLNKKNFIEILSYPHYSDLIVLGLNDESFTVQHSCVNLISKISEKNPMIILKSLHQSIEMLLNTLMATSSNAKLKQNSIYMIRQFLKYFHSYMRPYIKQLFDILHASLRESDGMAFSSYRAHLLETLGELFLSSEDLDCFNVNLIWSLLIEMFLETMEDSSTRILTYPKQKSVAVDKFLLDEADNARQSILSCFINISRSSTCQISAHSSFPEFQNALLSVLRFDLHKKTRILAISYLGYIGPVDYETFSDKISSIPSQRHHNGAAHPLLLCNKTSSSMIAEDHFAYHIFSILLKILSDPLLCQHHTITLQTIVFAITSLGEAATSLYEPIFSVLIGLFSSSSSAFLENLCHHLITLSCVAQYNFRPYLPRILGNLFKLLELNELSLSSTIFSLLHSLVKIFSSEMFPYVQLIFKALLRYLEDSSQFIMDHLITPHGSSTLKHVQAKPPLYGNVDDSTLNLMDSGTTSIRIDILLKIFEILPAMGRSLEEYLHLFLGYITCMVENPALQFFYRRQALDCITLLCTKVKITGHFSRIIIPLMRTLRSLSIDSKPSEDLFKEALLESIFIIISMSGIQATSIFTDILEKISSYSDLIKNNSLLDQAYMDIIGSFETDCLHESSFAPSTCIYALISKRFPQEASAGGPQLPRLTSSKCSLVPPEAFKLNQLVLKKAWDTSLRASKEDWLDWMKNITLELLIQSPSVLLRNCINLATMYPKISRELFTFSFHSCWCHLTQDFKDDILGSFVEAVRSPQAPEEIFLLFFDLVEFFERRAEPLKIDLSILTSAAASASLYVKALRYKELEFLASPSPQLIEPLITLYSLASLHDSAEGVLSLANHYEFPLQENWFEKLQKWDDALLVYKSNISAIHSAKDWGANPALKDIFQIDAVEPSETIGSFLCLLDSSSYPLASFSTFNFEKQPIKPVLSFPCANIKSILSQTSQKYLFDSLFDYSLRNTAFETIPFFNDIFGALRCLKNTYDWGRLITVGRLLWFQTPIKESSSFSLTNFRETLAPFIAISSWGLDRYDILAETLPYISKENFFSSFLNAVTATYFKNWTAYDVAIESAKTFLDNETSPFIFEKYTKSLSVTVKSQLITELEDVAEFFGNRSGYPHLGNRSRLEQVWSARLYAGSSSLEHMYQLLKIQSIIPELSPVSIKYWVRFANMCRKKGSILLSIRVLEFLFVKSFKIDINLLELCLSCDPAFSSSSISSLFVEFYNNFELFHLILNLSKILNDLQKHELSITVLSKLISFVIATLCPDCDCNGISGNGFLVCSHILKLIEPLNGGMLASRNLADKNSVEAITSNLQQLSTKETLSTKDSDVSVSNNLHAFLSKLLVLYSKWKKAMGSSSIESAGTTGLYMERNLFSKESTFSSDIITLQKFSIQLDSNSYKSWYSWALSNIELISQHDSTKAASKLARSNFPASPHSLFKDSKSSDGETSSSLINIIISAISGLIKSISLNKHESSIQDLLRILTLLFKYGSHPSIQKSFLNGCSILPIDAWLQVIPQLIARIQISNISIRRIVHQLLLEINNSHPQSLLYSLAVASKSTNSQRKSIAIGLLNKIRLSSPVLVDQTLLICNELVRVAVLWSELWSDGLEEASRLYHAQKDISGSIRILDYLHQVIQQEPKTKDEANFIEQYGSVLKKAREYILTYLHSKNSEDLVLAWDLYTNVFEQLSQTLALFHDINLSSVSPSIFSQRDFQLAVPGTYSYGPTAAVCIASFQPTINLIQSKQRPKKLKIIGSDGLVYKFLLKGNGDLRQDERVMQFFGLVNSILLEDAETKRRHLQIQKYPVIPISPTTGLLGWVRRCDTIHDLLKSYRSERNIPLIDEHQHMLKNSSNYDSLPMLHKIEIFTSALNTFPGDELSKIFWLQSKSTEHWLERRTLYQKSLALMSMVGYVLGLGDRHPSNLLVDRESGRIIHIDFGDCFEVSIHREKFPEQVPFRLTRMLVNAMEVSKTRGMFRIICEHVLRVLRSNKESLLAVLEAFIYDPLISMRLSSTPEPISDQMSTYPPELSKKAFSSFFIELPSSIVDHDVNNRPKGIDDLLPVAEEDGMPQDHATIKVLKAISRVSEKLAGTDFQHQEKPLDYKSQVSLLIDQATDIENLCQCYVGWCPFW
ncbi:phosphatidylinositol 3-kinase Tor2, partial [Mitosporidium daphniae]